MCAHVCPCTRHGWAPPQKPDPQCQGQRPHLHLCRPQIPTCWFWRDGGSTAAAPFLRTPQGCTPTLPACCTPCLAHTAPAFGLSTADAPHLLPIYPPAAALHQGLRDILSSPLLPLHLSKPLPPSLEYGSSPLHLAPLPSHPGIHPERRPRGQTTAPGPGPPWARRKRGSTHAQHPAMQRGQPQPEGEHAVPGSCLPHGASPSLPTRARLGPSAVLRRCGQCCRHCRGAGTAKVLASPRRGHHGFHLPAGEKGWGKNGGAKHSPGTQTPQTCTTRTALCQSEQHPEALAPWEQPLQGCFGSSSSGGVLGVALTAQRRTAARRWGVRSRQS